MKKHTIVVCMGSSCFSRGNNENLQAIRSFLELHGLEESVQLKGSRCEGACLKGPNITVDGQVFQGVTPEGLPDILRKTLMGGI